MLTKEELEQINHFSKAELTADQVYTFSVRLCDNEVDRDFERFGTEDLERLGELFLGKSGIFDHQWSAKGQTARIYRTEVVREPGTVTAAGDKTLLYTAGADKKLALVGISLTDVYFTETDNLTGEVEYLTVGQTGGNSTHFRAATEKNEVRSMALENGYFYYYQRRSEDKYDLVRQKFGSQKTVTLLEHVRSTDYPVVYGNRLYYTDYKSGAAQAMELNMNSGAKKVMLTASGADKSGTVAVACGYQYIFLIGKKTESGGSVYRASCIYTSASADNTMDFRSGKWSY